MLVLKDFFYVANMDGLYRYPYKNAPLKLDTQGTKILELPAGGYNNHWTRNIISNPEGAKTNQNSFMIKKNIVFSLNSYIGASLEKYEFKNFVDNGNDYSEKKLTGVAANKANAGIILNTYRSLFFV